MNVQDDHNHRYPTEAHGSVLAFHTLDEESEFFATFNFREFWEELEPVKLQHPLAHFFAIACSCVAHNLDKFSKEE
jgi:hypothetical protein